MSKRAFLYLVIVSTLLFSGCLICGKVVDENGVGVAGVTITLIGDPSRVVTTDSDGKFRFGDFMNFDFIPAGNYTVTPSKSRYIFTPETASCTITSQAVGDLEEILGPRIGVDFTAKGNGNVIVRGSPIHGANGIMFDSKDQLHIASVYGREIIVMDPMTGQIIERLGTDLGIEGPDDLAFGPDGSLYWTSILTGEVGRLSPEGVVTTQFVAPGVNPITFSEEGRLFVALDFLGDGLYELDPNLVDPPRPIVVATPENSSPLGWLNGMDFGPDGYLYGPIWTQQIVVRIDVDSCDASSSPWDDCDIEMVTDGFGVAAAVKFDSQGRLHVLDQKAGEVLRVDTSTGEKEVIARLTPGGDNLAFDSGDRLFISHAQDGSIYQVLPSGDTHTVSKEGIMMPGGVAVLPRLDGGESVFVADVHTLREFDGLTGSQRSTERNMIGFPGIIGPVTVSSDGDNLLLSSWDAIQVWNPETQEALLTLENPPTIATFNAIRFQGELIAAEVDVTNPSIPLPRLVRLDASDPNNPVRETLADFTHGLLAPMGIAATEDDLWISDWATGQVLQIIDDGTPLTEPVSVAGGLSFPEGLAVDSDGSLLVVETGLGQLSRINPEINEVTVLVDGLELGMPGPPMFLPMWMFNGVAVGTSGDIYVSGDVANVLYRFESFSAIP